MKLFEELTDSELDKDDVEFWIMHKSKFPKLFLCAQEVLGVPCSSASSERAFSVSGQISCCKRSSLSVMKVENLLIIKLR